MRGAAHPRTLDVARGLARTTFEQGSSLAITLFTEGRLAEAEELQVDTLEVSRRVRGAAHPDTLNIAHNLARTYDEQGRDADAEELRALYCL